MNVALGYPLVGLHVVNEYKKKIKKIDFELWLWVLKEAPVRHFEMQFLA